MTTVPPKTGDWPPMSESDLNDAVIKGANRAILELRKADILATQVLEGLEGWVEEDCRILKCDRHRVVVMMMAKLVYALGPQECKTRVEMLDWIGQIVKVHEENEERELNRV